MGRGIAVDEAALVDALHAGTIAGAALDVFEQVFAAHQHACARAFCAAVASCPCATWLCVSRRRRHCSGSGGDLVDVEVPVRLKEPLPESSPLWDCENLLLTAHNADFTEDYFKLGWDVWRSNLECFLEDRPMATLVDKFSGY